MEKSESDGMGNQQEIGIAVKAKCWWCTGEWSGNGRKGRKSGAKHSLIVLLSIVIFGKPFAEPSADYYVSCFEARRIACNFDRRFAQPTVCNFKPYYNV